MDSSAVYALFEELKLRIDELGKGTTPINQANLTSDPEELISFIENLRTQINQQQFSPEQIKVLQTNLGQISVYSLGKVNDSLRKVFTELKAIITPIDEKINLIKSQQNEIIRKEDVFTVDFRNSKAAITVISLALLILVSLGGNICQLNRNSQLKENDLKYRFIKSTNGINLINLNMLEDVFYYQRDKNKIREIRQKVEEYERKLIENAKEIERNRMQNEQNKR